MKKVILVFLFGCSFLALLTLNAQNKGKKTSETNKIDEKWVPIQFAFFPGAPKNIIYSRVYGIKIGFPISSGKGIVDGLEASMILSSTREVEGVQGAFANVCETGAGVQGAFVNIATEYQGCQFGIVNIAKKGNKKYSFSGIQFGLINHSVCSDGLQFGLLNFIEGGRFPFMPFINFNFAESID